MTVNWVPYIHSEIVHNKFYCVGSFFLPADSVSSELDVTVPLGEKGTTKIFLVHISLTMIYPIGGEFNEDDVVYADIYSIDRKRVDSSNGYGGASGGYFQGYGDARNQAISSYLGPVTKNIHFRIAQRGDNYVGATFTVMEV